MTASNGNPWLSDSVTVKDKMENSVADVEKSKEQDEYDPYAHREIELPNTFSGALIHMLKSSLGTGTLAVPGAMAAAGIIPGVMGTNLIGLLCGHTIYLLIHTSQEMCKVAKTPSLGFAETAEAVFQYGPEKIRGFARSARLFVDIGLATTYYGTLAVYVVFICSNIQQLTSFYHPDVEGWPPQYFMLMLLAPLIIFCQIRELKHLIPLSFVANTTMIIAFLITLYYMFDRIGDVNWEDRKLFNGVSLLPNFFSTIIFSMEGIGTMLPIENSMVKQQFVGLCGVLNIGLTSVTVLYVTVGFFGYYAYGDDVGPNIIAKLEQSDIAAQITQVCIIIAIFFTFMLQFYVPCEITWRMVRTKIRKDRHNLAQIIIRSLLVVVITIIAAAVPKLNAIIGLVGAIFFSTLGLMVTTALDTIRLWSAQDGDEDFGPYKWKLWKNIVILILWLFGMTSGTYVAIEELLS